MIYVVSEVIAYFVDKACSNLTARGKYFLAVVNLDHFCGAREQNMSENEEERFQEREIIDMSTLSKEDLQQIQRVTQKDREQGRASEGVINVDPSGSSPIKRAFKASSGEVIDLGDISYPEGTYFQNENIYYLDGIVVKNSLSPDKETIITLPNGNILKLGNQHRVADGFFIESVDSDGL